MARNGWHAVSSSHRYGQGGGGLSPSIGSRTAYTIRDEAIAAGINKLIRTFESLRDWKGYASQDRSARAQRMIETLKAHLLQSRPVVAGLKIANPSTLSSAARKLSLEHCPAISAFSLSPFVCLFLLIPHTDATAA